MQMTDHIKSLLYRYECVIIPEFGAFLTKRQPAQIDDKAHTLYPPKKAVVFNSQLQENDGLLVNKIAKAEGISYQQSLDKVKTFVENINESLQAHHQVRFDGVGLFYLQFNKIVFQPYSNNNFLLEAYGMETLFSKSIEAKQEKSIEPQTISEKVPSKDESKEEPVVISIPEEEETTSRPAYWRYAAVGIVAIGIGGFLGANWYSSQVKTHNIAAQEQAEKQIENKIQQATFMMDNPLPEVVFEVAAKPQGKYHIVAGAFRQKENAETKLAQLKDKGYKARYIGANKYGLHQVIYQSYENRRDALQALSKIRSTENEAAWLLVQEL